MAATVMHALDMTIANVVLPHMQGALLATQDQISWVLTSYVIASAIMTPPTGFLAARLGRKRFFQWSVAGFIAASMLCGVASSLTEMVVFRILQGGFGAALIPISQAILLDTYPRERHAQAMALWGVGVMVGPILGPTVGGYLTEVYDWRWIFFINLPVGIIAMLGIAASVPETPRDPNRTLDLTGFALLTVAVGALQLALDRGEIEGWLESTGIVAAVTIAGLCLYGFVVHSATVERPFLDLALLRDRNYAIGVLLIFLINLMMLATLALLPAFLQSLLGYPIVETGYLMMPRGVGTMVAMLIAGRIAGKIDARLIITAGLLLTSLSMWEMSRFNMNVDEHAIIVTGALQGFGMGLIFTPLSAMTFSTLSARLRTDGAAVFSLMRNLGSSIGVSVMTAYLSHGRQLHRAHLVEHVTPFNPILKDGPEALGIDTLAGLARLSAEISRQADVLAYLGDFYLLMLVPLIPLPLLLILKPRKYGRRA
ncbi:MAG: DHA2 family efflux MFS transporter permease subunit [Alphaproteobacteria bacterium]|nr:DHA2 family efflux MFS transporter permease subunit [Alphaproteobacteria bacterium]